MAAACTQGKRTQHGKPHGVVSNDQPNARKGQVCRRGVAERFVLPLRPGNSGGGKGPQFKTDATSSEGFGDWVTYQLRKLFRNCRRRCTRKRRQNPAIASMRCTTRSAVTTSRHTPTLSVARTRAHRGVDGQDFADIGPRSVRQRVDFLNHALDALLRDRLVARLGLKPSYSASLLEIMTETSDVAF